MVTGCLSVDDMSGEIKVMVMEDCETKQSFSFGAADGIALPFRLCEMDEEVYFSDHLRHCIYKINYAGQTVALALGKEGHPDQTDGPSDSAKLCFLAGITARGACLYVAEHPSQIQGAISMACSLQGLIRFQSTWHDVADAMGLVSERVRSSDSEYATTRNKTLVDALPAEKLKSLIRDKEFHRCYFT